VLKEILFVEKNISGLKIKLEAWHLGSEAWVSPSRSRPRLGLPGDLG
jgi:hypothetical protein